VLEPLQEVCDQLRASGRLEKIEWALPAQPHGRSGKPLFNLVGPEDRSRKSQDLSVAVQG
jgi:hypothetical protein